MSGYECPVCGVPQAEADHLANHVAFAAMLDEADHEAWLDEHAPDWNEMSQSELGAVVVEYAPESDVEFEEGEHAHAEQHFAQEGGYGRDDLGGDEQAIVEEAMELTQEMREGDEE
ncbi:DUF5810 domain-containing protein [Salarchaeum japonicum]|uniref:DUF5810 domain-containing protein n=1 Tax=Salarchaeum japonicum TaxID=555573 RepID=UPI003C7648BC